MPRGRTAGIPDANPYGYQQHLHDKTQPENLDFLKRFRALLDEYGARMAVGEVGDEGRSLATVAAYTSGGDKLQMCYTFDLLGPEFSAAHVRRCVTRFRGGRSSTAGSAGRSPTTTWCAMSRAGRGRASDPDARGQIRHRRCWSRLRGSICLYQGEELGLQEAEIAFEDLRDPYGIRFWPAFKGRDGCRTPMVWESAEPNAGFTTGKPWLPVPDVASRPRRRRPAGRCRRRCWRTTARALAFRREHPALVGGAIEFLDAEDDVLAFIRSSEGERLLCVFNFAGKPAKWAIPADARLSCRCWRRRAGGAHRGR